MNCKNCGKDNPPGSINCVSCGCVLGKDAENKVNIETTKPKKRNITALALGALSVVLAIVLVLSLTGVLRAAGGAGASKSFSTPEDAIKYFVERLKAGDIEGALSACAINEMAKGYNYKAEAERRQTIEPIKAALYLPSEYDLYVAYNADRIEKWILMEMACFSVSLNVPEEFDYLVNDMNIHRLENGQIPDGLIEALDPSKISGLELIEIRRDTQYDNSNIPGAIKEWAAEYGADDGQARVVLYKYNGNYYIGGFIVVEYNGRWLIQDIREMPYGCVPRKISDKSEFYDMLD